MKIVRKLVIFAVVLFVAMIFKDSKVSASYASICDGETLVAERGIYNRCDSSNIYLYEEEKEYSSYLVANRMLGGNNQILYAGFIDGLDTFYSLGFNFYSVVYDGSFDNNYYSDMSVNNVVIYSGKFEDKLLVDQSYGAFVRDFYNEKGTYLIRQFKDDKLLNCIRMIVVDKKDVNMDVNNVKYGDRAVDDLNLVYDSEDSLHFNIGEGKYGFDDYVKVNVNKCEYVLFFDKNLVVDSKKLKGCLISNEKNNVMITLTNGLGVIKSFEYKLNLYSDVISVKLEDSVSKLTTSSRRVLIKASAGVGNILDDSKCLYYWSTNPNDKLTYDDFMTNYQKSENKGTYSSNKGVILRDRDGVYYLYALAQDDDNYVVVRSNEYVMKKDTRLNNFVVGDFIFIVSLCVGATLPILIYLKVRGKDSL